MLQPDWADAFLTLSRAQLGLGEVCTVTHGCTASDALHVSLDTLPMTMLASNSSSKQCDFVQPELAMTSLETVLQLQVVSSPA